MKHLLRILVVEDSEDDTLLVLHQIKKGGYDVEYERVETAEQMTVALIEKKWDIILSDYQLPHLNGLEALKRLKESGIDLPFIIISGAIGEETAVNAMRAGAHDYIMKNNLQRLLPAIERELRESENREEQKMLEQKLIKSRALKISEKKLNKMISNMNVGILLQGMQAEILMSNSKALELLCISEDQLMRQSSFGLDWNGIHEDGSPFLPSSYPVFQAIASRNSIRNVVMGIYHPSKDNHIWLLLDAIPQLSADGNVRRVICTFIDITDRKKAEAEIELKNEELLKLNAQKDKFFSIIAHDLRGPFSSLLGITEIMVEEMSGLTIENKLLGLAVNMRDSATNLFRLLENLLQWASMQRGLIPVNPELIPLLPVVNESVAMALDQAKNKEIEITYNIAHELTVFADSNILQTVIRNLVSNAVKFTLKGGKINISATITSNNSIEISIKDTGIGMNSTMVDNLFRIDVRTNRKGTEGEPSTGLGLLLCKEFIEKQGGKIWVESEEGKGTTFYFTIP